MAHPVDVHVGKRIRQRRWLTGMTQQQLAQSVGIKFQQIQKYETGANRVSASRLWDIASALDVPVTFFFDGVFETSNVVFDFVQLTGNRIQFSLTTSNVAVVVDNAFCILGDLQLSREFVDRRSFLSRFYSPIGHDER